MTETPQFFEMEHPVQVHCTIWSGPQQKALGELLAGAVSEGRSFEVKDGSHRSVLVLLAPADNLGNVYSINAAGVVTEIGVTERV